MKSFKANEDLPSKLTLGDSGGDNVGPSECLEGDSKGSRSANQSPNEAPRSSWESDHS